MVVVVAVVVAVAVAVVVVVVFVLWITWFLARGQEGRVKILVGTSGDTGPAAGYSVAGLKQVDLVVLYPKSRVSRVQELQMTTIDADNVHIYAVDGTSDDLDVPIKNVFQVPNRSRCFEIFNHHWITISIPSLKVASNMDNL